MHHHLFTMLFGEDSLSLDDLHFISQDGMKEVEEEDQEVFKDKLPDQIRSISCSRSKVINISSLSLCMDSTFLPSQSFTRVKYDF